MSLSKVRWVACQPTDLTAMTTFASWMRRACQTIQEITNFTFAQLALDRQFADHAVK